MLESTRPWGAPVRPFMAAQVSYGVAREAWHKRGYWALRREIFCAETGLFASPHGERDEHDAHAVPLVGLAHHAGNPEEVVGIVRIYEAGPGLWYGGRLGVARAYRAHRHVGAGLIAAAVSGAKQRGCERFLATVLRANGAYFERHHFKTLSELDLCGRPHLLMQADLDAFPPRVAAARQAA